MTKALSRRSIAQYMAKRLYDGTALSELVNQLAGYLIESRRTKELGVIVRDIQYELSKLGYVTGTVTSAHELSAATQKALETYAKKQTNAKQVRLDAVVDPTVLGGVRLHLPGQELNATVAHHLLRLKTDYKKA